MKKNITRGSAEWYRNGGDPYNPYSKSQFPREQKVMRNHKWWHRFFVDVIARNKQTHPGQGAFYDSCYCRVCKIYFPRTK